MAERILAIIPARGGSKGLPGKHLLKIGEQTLVERAVLCAAECTSLSRLVVSTDDQAIADEAQYHGAEVPFMRPAELATDTASTWDVIKHAVGHCEREEGEKYDAIVLLQPTSPLRQASDVEGAIQLWRDKRPPSVVSVCESDKPMAWMLTLDEKLKIRRFDFRADLTRSRQDFAKCYRFNGAVYVYSRAVIDTSSSGVEPETLGFEMPKWRSVDIDTLADLIVAEAFWQNREQLEA